MNNSFLPTSRPLLSIQVIMSGVDKDGNAAFPAVLYAEPSSLGLLANVLAAFIVAMQNFLHQSETVPAAYVIAGGNYLNYFKIIFCMNVNVSSN